MVERYLTGKEVTEKLDIEPIRDSYRPYKVHPDAMRDAGYKRLAWTGRFRTLWYNPEKNILIDETEGDYWIERNPSKKSIEEYIQTYPMIEVGLGEKYDSRFK